MPLFLSVFVEICLPIAVLAAAGWAVDRLCGLDLRTLVKININVVVPAFIFVRVMESELAGAAAARIMLFTLTGIALMFVVSGALSRLAKEPTERRRSLQMATMFYNSGNYGLPLMTLAYPGVGPVIQVFVLLTQNISTFTVGLLLASSGGGRQGWRVWLPVLRQATLWGVLIAAGARIFEVPVTEWAWIWGPLNILADALVAVALFTLGVQLSQTDPRRAFRHMRFAVPVRLLGGPLIAALLVPLFGFEGAAAAVLILGAGVPTAVNISFLAHEFRADHAYVAAAVFYSTLFSMVTVTAVAAILRLTIG